MSKCQSDGRKVFASQELLVYCSVVACLYWHNLPAARALYMEGLIQYCSGCTSVVSKNVPVYNIPDVLLYMLSPLIGPQDIWVVVAWLDVIACSCDVSSVCGDRFLVVTIFLCCNMGSGSGWFIWYRSSSTFIDGDFHHFRAICIFHFHFLLCGNWGFGLIACRSQFCMSICWSICWWRPTSWGQLLV